MTLGWSWREIPDWSDTEWDTAQGILLVDQPLEGDTPVFLLVWGSRKGWERPWSWDFACFRWNFLEAKEEEEVEQGIP